MPPDIISDIMVRVENALWNWGHDRGIKRSDIRDKKQFESLFKEGGFHQQKLFCRRMSSSGTECLDKDTIAAAVAVLWTTGHDVWSPSKGASEAVRHQLIDAIHQVMQKVDDWLPPGPERYLRIPEIACAHFLGWPNRQVNWKSHGLDGIPSNVRYAALEHLEAAVGSCLSWLNRYVIGFPRDEQPLIWAEKILNRLIAKKGGCACWTRVAELSSNRMDTINVNPNRLRGNAKRKAQTCLTQHRLQAWDPRLLLRKNGSSWTLWRFLQRAAKGFLGNFRPAQFPSGMFWDCWQTAVALDRPELRLALVKVAKRYCPQCGTGAFGRYCTNPADVCLGWHLSSENSWTEINRAWIILSDPDYGGWKADRVWICKECKGIQRIFKGNNPPSGRNNIYPADLCRNGCSSDGAHDICPLCGREHSHGKGRKTSTVYFLL